jgi:hypothetical protein
MDYQSIFIGVLSSLIASFLFLAFLFVLRPKLVISECIARTTHDGAKVFIIKMVNRTWWKLYDIHAELAHVKFENATGGQNVYSQRLNLLKSHIWSINCLHSWRTDVNAEYAVLFVCLDDLDTLWSSDTMIEFRIMARHSFSGFSGIYRRRFYKPRSAIKDGSFKFGNSLDID